jgi:hypothetical protein
VPLRRSRTDDSAEAVEAEQDGLGSVELLLTDEEGIYAEGGEFSCPVAWSGVLFGAFAGENANRQFSCSE